VINDNDPATLDKAWTFRNISLMRSGVVAIEARVKDAAGVGSARASAGVQDFRLNGQKNIILYIGDAMGTAYRDVSRIVAKSTGDHFREGFFDELQEMDEMPVSGMVMTYSSDRIVPDSAPTATAWSTGNKTVEGRSACSRTTPTSRPELRRRAKCSLWIIRGSRRSGSTSNASTVTRLASLPPRKSPTQRRQAKAAHTILRGLQFDIAKQYIDGGFGNGPTFDVIMGGAKERFDGRTLANSGDTRNLPAELQAKGYTYINTRTQLNALPDTGAPGGKLLGLFRTGNMNVAYDKLGLVRPVDEVTPPFGSPINFGGFTDQPFLDEMTAKAIATLRKGRQSFHPHGRRRLGRQAIAFEPCCGTNLGHHRIR
jgi:alkaline phosphatase